MTSETRRARWAPRLRLIAYLAALQVVAVLALAALVRARADEALLRVGELVMRYAGASHQQEPRTLVLNGARVGLSVGVSERPVADVLDHFERQCRQHSGNLREQLTDALHRAGGTASEVARAQAWPDAVVRVDEPDRGVIACLDLGAGELSMTDLARRAEAMLATGDVSTLGALRFVSVERGDTQTVFVTSWSDGPIDATAMFPAQGDVPGADVPNVPRPVHARRLLSAREEGQTKAFNAYAVEGQSVEAARRTFSAQLSAAGFDVPQSADDQGALGYVAQRGDAAVVVAFVAQAEGETIVTISSLSNATAAVSIR